MKLNEFVRRYIPSINQFFSIYELLGYTDDWDEMYGTFENLDKKGFYDFAKEQYEYLLDLEVLEIGTDVNDKLYICAGSAERLELGENI